MDNNMVKFVLKVMIASAAISFAIKYIGPLLQIPVSSAIALIAVLLPPGILGGILLWRGSNQSKYSGSRIQPSASSAGDSK